MIGTNALASEEIVAIHDGQFTKNPYFILSCTDNLMDMPPAAGANTRKRMAENVNLNRLHLFIPLADTEILTDEAMTNFIKDLLSDYPEIIIKNLEGVLYSRFKNSPHYLDQSGWDTLDQKLDEWIWKTNTQENDLINSLSRSVNDSLQLTCN